MSIFRSNDIENILNDIAYLKKKVGCCEGDFGLTELSPPVTAPGNGDPTVLFNLTTGVIYYWDGDSWEIYGLTLEYKVVVSQTGVSAPTAAIGTNTLGETPTYSRTDIGEYELISPGSLFVGGGKTIVQVTIASDATAYTVRANRSADNKILFKTYDITGTLAELIGDVTISVEIYP